MPLTPDRIKSLVVVVDLDGTLFDSTQRADLVPSKEFKGYRQEGINFPIPKSEWIPFHGAHIHDTVVPGVQRLVQMLDIAGYEIRYLSYRPVEFLESTVAQLKENELPSGFVRLWEPTDPEDISHFKCGVVLQWRKDGDEPILCLEDSLRTARDMQRVGVPTVIVPHPYTYREA